MISFKPQRTFFLLLIGFSIAFSGCNKCTEKQSGSYKFTDRELQIIPYSGPETLIFLNLSGDTMHFQAGERVSSMIQDYPNREDECKGNYYLLENNTIDISSGNNSWLFSLTLYVTPTPTSDVYSKIIEFEASVPAQRKTTLSDAFLLFEQDSIMRYQSASGPELIFHDSLTIGSKIFTNVYEINLIREYNNSTDWVDKIYYTISQGIVGFSTHRSELWYFKE
jgi:hypothetical protein